MNKILMHERLGPDVYRMEFEAPQIAKKRRAGQFIILRVDEHGERIPLTIVDSNAEAGTLTIIYQAVGKTTMQLATLEVGASLRDVVGPLGQPTEIEHYGTCVCIGGGIGNAPLFPIASALKKEGNHVITITGARTRELMILEDELRIVSDELIVCTDDGSYGRKALVTEPLKELLEGGRQIDLVVAIGPAIMMKFVSLTTAPFGVKTLVSLNSIMIDGTGMCGGCRVTVGGETKFTCVDGPEFDGHQVDWEQMLKRMNSYKIYEAQATERWLHRREQDETAHHDRLCRLEEEIRKADSHE